MNKIENKSTLIVIIAVSVAVITVYFFLLLYFKNPKLSANEYGDYVGGVLNPLFTLLSTLAIIILSYIIFKGESQKTDESILIQKRLTLNQMRHEELNLLSGKLSLFVYETDKYHMIQSGKGKFYKTLLANELNKKNADKDIPNIWNIMLFELEAFSNKKYLFESLFSNDEYKNKFDQILNSLTALSEEQNNDKLISIDTLSKYIEDQQNFVGIIGNFILKEY